MALTLEYPNNWTEIATTVKQAAGYRCNRCGLKCLPPNNSYRHLELSLRRKLSALLGETHNWAGDPSSAEETSAQPIIHQESTLRSKIRWVKRLSPQWYGRLKFLS
ncbi:hypothetical protein [Chamaesiphon sp.]|uniref:hypothetical protein n=1 Tax=Chamaesiphon sp. TaxID=2814140 RepID=UPI003593345E